MPASTSPEKIALIEAHGGSCLLVDDASRIVAEAQRLAADTHGHFLDQFTYAERATDWRGNNNIAESIFSQMALEQHPIPAWVVLGAGTGGTSATIGRYSRLMRYPTRLCVVDPEDSIFYSHWTGDPSTFTGRPSRIEGIGRQRVESSFLPDVIDRMLQVPDAASIATMRLVRARTGRSVGGSTGTNVWGALLLVAEMLSRGERGSVVTLICDAGDRYAGTYYSDAWVADQRLDLAPYTEALETFFAGGAFAVPVSGDLVVLDVGDDVADRVHDLRRDLVHPVCVARVDMDVREQLLLVVVARHPLAARHHVAAPELLHRALLNVWAAILTASERPAVEDERHAPVRSPHVPDPRLPG